MFTSNMSQVCRWMDDEYEFCQPKGADGFAFIVYNDLANIKEAPLNVLGRNGSGLGMSRSYCAN